MIHCRVTTPAPHDRRRGLLSLELLFTLPIFGLLLMGLFEYSLLFATRGDVVAACRTGARRATLAGATPDSVESDVRQVLGRLGAAAIVESQCGDRTGDPVVVSVRVPMRLAAPDLLWPIGFGLTGRSLFCEIQMVKE